MNKKQVVIKTATDLFARYNRISMMDVAKVAGVSKPTIYYYADNIDDLLNKCLNKAYIDYRNDKATSAQIVLLVKEMLRQGDYKQAEFTLQQYFK